MAWGFLSGGLCPGSFCPGVFCPVTLKIMTKVNRKQKVFVKSTWLFMDCGKMHILTLSLKNVVAKILSLNKCLTKYFIKIFLSFAIYMSYLYCLLLSMLSLQSNFECACTMKKSVTSENN